MAEQGLGDRRAWHRRASRPVIVWIMIALLLALTQFLWPQPQWLLVHALTLGIITNSILVWGQHFTEALLRQRVPDAARGRQVGRIGLLNVGIVVAFVAMAFAWPWLLVAGAAVIAAAVAWWAVDLLRAIAASTGARFTATVRTYVAAALLLPVGATLGALLAFPWPEGWRTRLLLAHEIANVLGFAGLMILGTLVTLWPTILRTKMAPGQARAGTIGAVIMAAAVVAGVGLALLGTRAGVVAALAGYAAGLVVIAVPLVRCAAHKPPRDFPAYSVGFGALWLLGGVVAMVVLVARRPLTASAPFAGLAVPLLLGGLAQVVVGAMSYLMPTVLGGGPAVTRRSCAIMNRVGALRAAVTNTGVLVAVVTRGAAALAGLFLATLALAAFVGLVLQMITTFARRGSAPAAPPAAAAPRSGLARREVVAAAVGAGGTVGIAALAGRLAGTPALPADAVRVAVSAKDMRFHPDTVDVPRGSRLVVALTNDDPDMLHDLAIGGAATPRLEPGATATLDAGVIDGPVDGWCTVSGHRAAGMLFHVRVGGATAATPTAAGAVAVDLTQPPGAGFATRDAALPPLPAPGSHDLTLTIQEAVQEVAPGFAIRAMTYNGRVMGPVITGSVGDRIACTLVNQGTMGHSVDFHAGDVSPDAVMRTIRPGEQLRYDVTLNRAGVWLYHCSTAPLATHLAAGMFGAVIVPPAGIAKADREFVVVQSEGYLGAPGGEIDSSKILTERPDVILFNGHANQYAFAPLAARAGERVRFWVLAAGPSRGISFHVVGAQFDTVFKEGAYLLRPDNAERGGAQALDLAAAQGGFVECVFREPGTYTFVNHAFVDMQRGARGIIKVT